MSLDLPTLGVECAFGTRPTEAPVWTDISVYVRAVSVRRGRNNELDQVQAGTARVLLDNRDGRFSPGNTAGAYYPNVKRMRRMRIRATWAGVTYPLYAGYVEHWPQAYPVLGFDAVSDVPLVDGFAVLSLAKITASWPQERSDQRIARVLDAANWTVGESWVLGSSVNSLLGQTTVLGPVGDRALDEGNSEVQASTLDGVDALGHLRDVELAESGLFFVNRSGVATFHNRHRRLHPASLVPRAVFGNTGAPDELPYQEIELDDDTPLWTRVEWQREGGTLQTAEDQDARLDYFPRVDRRTGLLLTTDSEVLSHARARLNRYSQPGARVASLAILPQADPDRLWTVVLGRELAEVVTVRYQPRGGGDTIEQDAFIEGIELDARPGMWTVRWWLSPVDTSRYWVLGTPGGSELGVATRLAY